MSSPNGYAAAQGGKPLARHRRAAQAGRTKARLLRGIAELWDQLPSLARSPQARVERRRTEETIRRYERMAEIEDDLAAACREPMPDPEDHERLPPPVARLMLDLASARREVSTTLRHDPASAADRLVSMALAVVAAQVHDDGQ